jgi:hypothetical protein
MIEPKKSINDQLRFQVDVRSISVQKAPEKKTHRLPRHNPLQIEFADIETRNRRNNSTMHGSINK